MAHLRSSVFLFLTFSLVCRFAYPAQIPGSSSSERSTQSDATPAAFSNSGSSEQRARSLLIELLERADVIVVGSERPLKLTLLKADIADILWEHDRARSRQLFSHVFQKAEEFSPGNPIGGRFSLAGTDMRTLLRKQIIDIVLTHDHEFAEELVRSALRAGASNRTTGPAGPMDQSRQEVALYSRLATAFSASDPSRAAQLIRRSLNGFWSDELIVALRELRKQSPILADEIFLEALAIVRKKPTNVTNKIGILAPYPFPEMKNDVGLTLKEIESESGPPPDSSVVVQFLSFVFESFNSQSIESQIGENNELSKSSFDYFTMKSFSRTSISICRKRLLPFAQGLRRSGKPSRKLADRIRLIPKARPGENSSALRSKTSSREPKQAKPRRLEIVSTPKRQACLSCEMTILKARFSSSRESVKKNSGPG